jgi:hypothetical protein
MIHRATTRDPRRASRNIVQPPFASRRAGLEPTVDPVNALEFRIEAYNVTNTPTFCNPARDISAANFGQITRTCGGPRVIQLGLKFRF